MSEATARIGTAGWSLPAAAAEQFDSQGTHLERYASRLSAVEINSSFYRPHRRATYERWAASVPPPFRFSVKLPRTISHAPSGSEHDSLVDRFAHEVAGLGEKLGVVLVQFPPKHVFEQRSTGAMFDRLTNALACPLVCEPRHASWFTADAEESLRGHRISRVAADPAVVKGADEPGGWPGLRYYRLHGSPHIYRSSYEDAKLAELATRVAASVLDGVAAWCVFDNTASGAATGDALAMLARLRDRLP